MSRCMAKKRREDGAAASSSTATATAASTGTKTPTQGTSGEFTRFQPATHGKVVENHGGGK